MIDKKELIQKFRKKIKNYELYRYKKMCKNVMNYIFLSLKIDVLRQKIKLKKEADKYKKEAK